MVITSEFYLSFTVFEVSDPAEHSSLITFFTQQIARIEIIDI